MSAEQRDELKQFLSAVWGDETAYVFLAVKNDDGGFKIPNVQIWPDAADALISWGLSQSARGNEVYYSMATYENPTAKSKDNVQGSRVLWADLDGNADKATASLAPLGLPAPTWRVSSGRDGHEHWYWLLDAQIGAQAVEDFNKRIAYALRGDNCWNADRVLRLPFTQNHMIGKKDRLKPGEVPPFAVDFINKSDAKYTTVPFSGLPKIKEQIEEKVTLGVIPKIADVISKYKWPEKEWDIFQANDANLIKDRDNHYMAIAYWSAEVGMSDEEIYAVVQDLDSRLGKFVGRSDRERRLVEMVTKARQKHPTKTVETVHVNEDMKIIYGIKELLNADFKIEWLIDDFIPKRTINFISAESGIGKSRLSLDLAFTACRGGEFLDWTINKPMKVAYLSLEMAADMLKHFAGSLTEGEEVTDQDDEMFKLIPVGNAIDLTSNEGLQFVRDIIEEVRPDLMFIDAMGSLTMEELGETQAKTINNRLKELINEFGTTFFVIHHNRKSGQDKKRPTLSDVYGSQYVLTEAAVALAMWRPSDNNAHIELVPIKTRAGVSPKPINLDGSKGFKFEVRKGGYFDDEPDVEPTPQPGRRYAGIG